MQITALVLDPAGQPRTINPAHPAAAGRVMAAPQPLQGNGSLQDRWLFAAPEGAAPEQAHLCPSRSCR
ncbi:hypothetical protein [Paraburkholderia domus]|uniref:hypothetical protein n=1 Tax=Paraburkholderia domus TaxID=2793075 RepID=UPI0019119DBB|nr:hypothetical protein [Paraburkholderia domus]MBK5125681.1 hypothetical protein [Burkholderia sp. R-69980]MBK5186328.1 hypothetical protein [Burkholderia sp. R-69749]CAE6881948.1 hypothetical protein R69749_07092 [Paraburkholderia domus]